METVPAYHHRRQARVPHCLAAVQDMTNHRGASCSLVKPSPGSELCPVAMAAVVPSKNEGMSWLLHRRHGSAGSCFGHRGGLNGVYRFGGLHDKLFFVFLFGYRGYHFTRLCYVPLTETIAKGEWVVLTSWKVILMDIQHWGRSNPVVLQPNTENSGGLLFSNLCNHSSDAQNMFPDGKRFNLPSSTILVIWLSSMNYKTNLLTSFTI